LKLLRVSLTPTAHADVRSILQWIGERSRTGAQAWDQRWEEVLQLLSTSADSCSLAPESDDHEIIIRDFNFKTRRGRIYRVLFTVREQRVIVLHVRGPGQDLVPRSEMRPPE